MDFRGIVVFDNESHKFEYFGNSIAKVAKLLDMDWNTDMRKTPVKLTLNEKVRRLKLFVKVRKEAFKSEGDVENLVENFNQEFVVNSFEYDGDATKTYEFMTERNDVNFDYGNVGLQTGEDGDYYPNPEEVKNSLSDLKNEIFQEFKQFEEEFRQKIVKQLQSPNQYINNDQPRKPMIARSGSFSNDNSHMKIIKHLPFSSNEQIEDFFTVEGNANALYNLMKKFFTKGLWPGIKGKNERVFGEGMRALLSKEYIREHMWGQRDNGRNPNRVKLMSKTLRMWLEFNFCDNPPYIEHKRFSRLFSDARVRHKNKEEKRLLQAQEKLRKRVEPEVRVKEERDKEDIAESNKVQITMMTNQENSTGASEDSSMVTSGEDSMVTSEEESLVSNEKDSMVTSEESGMVASDDNSIVTSEESSMVSSEESSMVTSEESSMVSSEENSVVTSEGISITGIFDSFEDNAMNDKITC